MKVTKLLRNATEKQILVTLFIFTFLLRIGVILVLGQSQKWHENVLIAINLISGKGFSYSYFPPATSLQQTCIMAPFYPFFLAAIFTLLGVNDTALLAVQIVQVTIGALTILPIYYLSRSFFSQRTAVISCLIFAVYPDFLYYVFVIHPLTFTTFLVPTLVYFTDTLQKTPTFKKAIVCGILYGFSLLVEPVVISLFGLMVLWIAISWIRKAFIRDNSSRSSSRLSLKKKGLTVLVLIVSCGLVISPWEIRCLAVYDGNFVFIKASGFNLWRGNNAKYTETGIPPWYEWEMVESVEFSKEGDIDQMFYDLAISYISSHIGETFWNSIRKIVDLWWFPKVLPEQSPLVRKLTYLPLLALAIGAMFYERKRIRKLIPLMLPLLSFTLLYSITFVLPRYRIPIQPLLFIFSAYGVLVLLEAIITRSSPESSTHTNGAIQKDNDTRMDRMDAFRNNFGNKGFPPFY